MDPKSGTSGRDSPQRMPETNRMQQPYKFTADELRVIRECNRESFYQRCLPLGSILGVSTYYGVKSGYLRPNLRFGAAPKVAVAAVLGYFLGKFSYQSKCAEKLMQLPDSQVGEMLRRRRKGTWQESLDPGFGPGMSLAPFSGMSTSDVYTDVGSGRTNIDIDTSRPQFDGLDDSRRPSMDSPDVTSIISSDPVYEEEEMPPVQKNATTYDELRKKNREEHQHKRTMSFRDVPNRAAAPPASSMPQSSDGQRNRYGDVWEG